jgi:hypothetical protein
MLMTLAQNTGVSVVWDINAKGLLAKKEIQLIWNSEKMPSTDLYLLARKNDTLNSILEEVKEELSRLTLN